MQQFRVEVADGGEGKVFTIENLGEGRYQISLQDEVLGNIRLDGNAHDHCEQEGCEIDLPLLNSIREAIESHEANTQS
ncbi:hypothetical protein C7T94_12620 [Pedobacter yulinensis]|uniref:Uncharacterized protein n=1 Tax=Pedobacter yulinensis TaxID=2126353 RepID=A0A2T3HN04_9SPHI|nr:hypothetical protein [Pedobacter yulinensis]PST83842.1 hypothetical protein C7T94_12620 [Pedobacter yulinensis]